MTDTSSTVELTQEQKARAYDALVVMLKDKAEFVSRRSKFPESKYDPGTYDPVKEEAFVHVDTFQWILRAPTNDIDRALRSLLPEFKFK